MSYLARRPLDLFSLELRAVEEFTVSNSSVSVYIHLKEVDQSRLIQLPFRDTLYSVEFFNAISEGEKECVVCGGVGADYERAALPRKIHEECRKDIEREVERFVSDNSDLIVGHEI